MLNPTLIATILLVGTVAVQQKPDFSGEWILNRAASTLSPGADGVQSGVVRIDHREPMFRYKATLVSEGKPFECAYELLSDGREVAGMQQGRATKSSLRWDGDVLVYTGRMERPDGEMTISFRYELLEGGLRLRGVERVRGPGRQQDNVWIFERRRPGE